MYATPSLDKASGVQVASRGCPCCASRHAQIFYALSDFPVHTVQVIRERARALDCVKGDIRLAFCEDCGFVWNEAFDAKLLDYAVDYESTQSCSPTFNRFHVRLARDLIERYDLRNKDIIEIGCGQGEFLKLICEMGDNRGTGFDPAYIGSAEAGPIRVISDYYSEQHSGHQADFVCCKMTLEHISESYGFVEQVHRVTERRPNTVVFFQIPDIDRILDERAFWDIYYEHCSYFSAGSLARLFRRAGFVVRDVWRDYGDQYLMIEAHPAGAAHAPLAIEEGLPDQSARIARFRAAVARDIQAWQGLIRNAHQGGLRPVIWGGGSKGVTFLFTLGITDEIAYAVDINPKKSGTYFAACGQQVVAPAFLKDYRPGLVIAMNPIYRAEIAEMLADLGVPARIVTVDAMARGEIGEIAA